MIYGYEKKGGKSWSNKCDNRALQNNLKQNNFDTCSTRKRVARDILLMLLAYCTLLSRNGDAGCANSGHRGEEVAVAHRRFLKNLPRKHELEMYWWRTCSDMK